MSEGFTQKYSSKVVVPSSASPSGLTRTRREEGKKSRKWDGSPGEEGKENYLFQLHLYP